MDLGITERAAEAPATLQQRLHAIASIARSLRELNMRARGLQRDAVHAFAPLFALRDRAASRAPVLQAAFSMLRRYLTKPLAHDEDATIERRALARLLRSMLDCEQLQVECHAALSRGDALASLVVEVIPEAQTQVMMSEDRPEIALTWRAEDPSLHVMTSAGLVRRFLDDPRAEAFIAVEPGIVHTVRLLAAT